MTKNVLIVTEFRNGDYRRVTYEVASEARRIADALGAGLIAVSLGSGVSGKAAELGKYGVDKVYVLDDPALEYYLAETYVPIIAQIVEKTQPVAILLPASVDGRDIGARLCGTIDVTLVQDVIEALQVKSLPGASGAKAFPRCFQCARTSCHAPSWMTTRRPS
jgi:electron transfer flavoprotein alpha subunit